MAELIYDEMSLFGICFALGVMLAFIYDGFRILRLLVPHKDVVVDIEDLIFWIFTAWIVFKTLMVYNRGMLRAYAFMGMFLGVVLYAFTLSRLLLGIVKKLSPYWKKCFRTIISPFKLLSGYIRKKLKKMAAEVKIAVKGR
jgi:spore cortex biosynthesis protein YabQ